MFRGIPGNMTLNKRARRRLTEMTVIEKFQPLVDIDADGFFLKLTPEAATYWGQNNREFASMTKAYSEMKGVHDQSDTQSDEPSSSLYKQ